MLIDVRTAYFILGLLYIILPLTVLLLLKDHKTIPVKFWCFGGLMAGLGMLTLGLRPFLEGKVHGLITYTLPNAMMVIGYSMRAHSLQLDIQKPIQKEWFIASIALFLVFFELARSPLGTVQARMIVSYFWIGATIFLLAKAAYGYEKKFAITQIRFIWVTYFILAIVLIFKAFLLALNVEKALPFDNTFSNGLIIMFATLSVIYSNLAYVGIMLARAEIEGAHSAKKNTRLLTALNKQTKVIKDLMRVQAFSVVGTYGSTVVHEVLQPLTAMRFALENLKMHLLRLSQDKVTQDRIDAVDSSAARAISVIENLRNFIVEREVQVGPVSLNSIIREVLEITASRAAGMGVQITLNITDKITVLADAHQLQRVLFNIVNNALDAIERNPSNLTLKQILIDTKYVQQKQFVLIKVIDTGVGLQAKDQAEIFEWLSSSSSKGMGVGLALSRILVESWHGHISAYNADPNIDGLTGAVFELKLKSA